MSIELHKEREESQSSSFVMSVKMPDLSQKSTAIKIESNPMEKKKEENIEKKKPEQKFFYELLEEAVKKGLRPIIHQYQNHHEYDCPVALVCTLLGETFEDEDFHQVRDGPCGCTIRHTDMINMLRKHNVKFLDTKMDYCICCDENDEGDGDDDDYSIPCGHDNERNFTEPMLAIHISRWHSKGNLETVELLKESLYGKKRKKVKQLPKKEEEEPMFTFAEQPGILTTNPTWTVKALGNTVDVFDKLNAKIQSMDITFDPTTHIARTRYKAYVRDKDGHFVLREFDSDR